MCRNVLACLLTLIVLDLGAGAGRAQAPTTQPDRIEEDWQLVVDTPDPVGAGPQITTSMSPVADGSTPFVAFDLNYREYPSFDPGGMQVQVWSDKQLLTTATQESDRLETTGETITWTQRMSLSQGTISYRVKNGQSTTWGGFGENNQLEVNFSTSLTSLAGYSPGTTVANSGVSWQANHVTSMTLVQVRYYAGSALIATDSTPRTLSLQD